MIGSEMPERRVGKGRAPEPVEGARRAHLRRAGRAGFALPAPQATHHSPWSRWVS